MAVIMHVNQSWCDAVKIKLIEMHITQRKLAHKLGVKETYLSAILNGKKISPNMGSLISDYLNLDNNYLETEDE